MTIVPAWIRKRDETGVWAILGSEPPLDAKEVFVPESQIESVVMHDQEVHGRKFGILVLTKATGEHS